MQNKKKILLVDDTEDNLDLLIEFLSENYDLSIAMDGISALKRVELDLPDLVLLDIMMPEMDGYEVCQTIKLNPLTKDIPIIFLTAKTDANSIVKGFELGAADYVTKPFYEEELLARVKVHIDLKHAREVAESARKEAELAKQKAEQSEKLKSIFLTTMSHEIRTPMNGVLGMATLLMDTNLDPLQQEYIDSLTSSGEMLLVIINDILDFSKIESGKMTLEKQSFQLTHCIKDVYRLMASSAAEKDIELHENIDKNVPNTIIGDETRLRQILFNLIGNAIKFTEKGEISASIKTVVKENQKIKLEFSVKDTGIGIPSEKKNLLFKSFSQLDTSTTRKYGGTGLGLAICDRLVKLMGGKIWVESEEGKGAAFFFTIETTTGNPQTESEKIPSERIQCFSQQDKQQNITKDHASPQHPQLKILVVEDVVVNQKVVVRFLKKLGYHSDIAKNGLEALNALDKKSYDLILMDIMMPVMNGITATQEIRQKYGSDDHPWIVALTADAFEGKKEAYLAKGMNDYLSKPININKLKKILDTYIAKTA
jgi:signal transduction histidine kinase/BarA-like signal transduction histidine kinase